MFNALLLRLKHPCDADAICSKPQENGEAYAQSVILSYPHIATSFLAFVKNDSNQG
jgi:hypothetical protein